MKRTARSNFVCRRRHVHPRRAFTLIELLVVIATATVLMTVAVTTLTLLMRAEQAGTAGISSSLALSRLANDFRRDVRAASAAELQPGESDQPDQLRLSLATDRNVFYQLSKSTIIRREATGDGDESIRVEAYAIDARTAQFDLPGDSSTRLVSIRLVAGLHDRAPTRGRFADAAPRSFQIDATLGSDRRFEE